MGDDGPVVTRGNARRRDRPGHRFGALATAVVLVAAGCGSGSNGSDRAGGGGSAGTGPAANLATCPLDALDGASQPVEVEVWHAQLAKQGDTLAELVDEYNRSQSRVRVRLENAGGSDEELLRKFQSAVPTKQLPAVFQGNDTETQLMADSGVVLPAQSCIDAGHTDLAPFARTVVDYYTIDGVLWPASANPSSVLFYWNKDHFRRAGLDPEQPPRTLAELRADAEKIKAAGVTDTPFVHEPASYKTEFWLTGAHASIVDHDNGRAGAAERATLDASANADALELFRWFKGMQDDGLLLAVPATEGQINQYLAMATGQASMAVESSGSATSVEAFLAGNLDTSGLGVDSTDLGRNAGIDVGAGPLPGIHEAGRTQMGGPAWYITSTSPPEVQAAAWDFLTFMNGEHAQTRMLTGGSYLPYRTSAAQTPEARQFFSSSLAGRWLEVANEQVQTIDPAFPGPLIGPYADVRDALRDALSSQLFEGVTPEAALDGAQRATDDALRRYGEGGF